MTVISCGDSSKPEATPTPSYEVAYGGFRGLSAKSLRLNGVTHRLRPAVNTEGECFTIDASEICLSPEAGAIQLAVRNEGSSELVFDLAGGAYRDEHGKEHGIYAFPDARGWEAEWRKIAQPYSVLPGARAVFFIAPIDKAYYVRESDEEHNLIHEVMVPWEIRGRSKEEIRDDQAGLVVNRTPVFLILPVTINGTRQLVEIDFVLEDP